MKDLAAGGLVLLLVAGLVVGLVVGLVPPPKVGRCRGLGGGRGGNAGGRAEHATHLSCWIVCGGAARTSACCTAGGSSSCSGGDNSSRCRTRAAAVVPRASRASQYNYTRLYIYVCRLPRRGWVTQITLCGKYRYLCLLCDQERPAINVYGNGVLHPALLQLPLVELALQASFASVLWQL